MQARARLHLAHPEVASVVVAAGAALPLARAEAVAGVRRHRASAVALPPEVQAVPLVLCSPRSTSRVVHQKRL